jgi:hypothetical protein
MAPHNLPVLFRFALFAALSFADRLYLCRGKA